MRRYNTVIKVAALIALPGLLLTGCMSFNPQSLRAMETALMASNPDLQIESSMKFGFGALTMDLVDFAFVHDRSIDVSKISRADIGIYELKGTLVVSEFRMPQDDATDRNCPRREVIVRIREEDEYVDIVVCIKGEQITGLAVFVLEPDEIVVINTRGDFESLIHSVVKGSMNRKPRDPDTQAGSGYAQSMTVAKL